MHVPDDLVGVQAYILWEQAGKPDGADFGGEARQMLEGRLRGGESLADIERSLRGPQPAPAQQQGQQQEQQEQPREQQRSAPAAPKPAVVGQSMGVRSRNPLDMINRSTAPLLSEKKRAVRSPLTPLLEATQDDPNTTWHRVSRTPAGGSLPDNLRGTPSPTARAAPLGACALGVPAPGAG